MSKQSIKATIDANIKQNGVQAITGQIMNSVLNQMVDNLAEEASTTEKLTELEEEIGENQPVVTWTNGYLLAQGSGVVRSDDSTVWKISNDITLREGQTITLHHGANIPSSDIVVIGKKNEDGTYTSLLQGSPQVSDYSYTAIDDCIIVMTALASSSRTFEVHFDLMDKINANTNAIGTMQPIISALQSGLASTTKLIVVAAYDCSSKWDNLASFKAISINDGIPCIIRAITLAKEGDVILLSDGTFKSSENSGVEVSKSVSLIGQGVNTYIERTNDAADITIDYDGVSAVVKNLNVRHAVNIASKNDHERYESSIYLEQIYVQGVEQDCETLNYILNSGYATIAATASPWKYYATIVTSPSTAIPVINAYTYYTNKLPDSADINKRTLLLLPAHYKGEGGIEFNKSLPTRLTGLKGFEKLTIVERTDGNIALRQDIHCSPSTMNDAERVIENLSFKELVGFVRCSNFRMVNCFRDGIRLADFRSGNIFEVGTDRIFSQVTHAYFVAQTYATPTNRCTIVVHGSVYENTIVDLNVPYIDVDGCDSAKIYRVGQNQDAFAVDVYRAGYAVKLGGSFNGYMRNIDIYLAGCQKGIDLPALSVNSKKARIINVRAYNLSFPAIAAKVNGEDVLVRVDDNHNIVRCVADSTSTTGYKAHVYSKVFGTETGSYDCTAADASAAHNIHLTTRKPDAELATGWEDMDGGRRHGIELYLANDCEVELINCEGYGSPWGFHNTRGIYVLGSPRLVNCKGVGGGIGHRNHGILCHDNSEAELIGCIGVASPFAYLTPLQFNQHGVNYNGENHCGIKFQRMSASKLTNCIGYGNDMPMGHGIQADMRTFPKLVGCEGYIGGGANSAGLCITEYATMDVSGGFFGTHSRVYEQSFKANSGKGMIIYPYKRPTRKDASEDDVLYSNHWVLDSDNQNQPYRIENVTFTRGNVSSASLGGAVLKLYDAIGASKTLVASETLINENGGYQYVNIEPYVIAEGHHLYVAFERDGAELTAPNGIIALTLGVSEYPADASGVYINQYWSHERTIDVDNPPYNVVRPAIVSSVFAKSSTALRIGANASKAQEYNVILSTLQGSIYNEGAEETKVINCVLV